MTQNVTEVLCANALTLGVEFMVHNPTKVKENLETVISSTTKTSFLYLGHRRGQLSSPVIILNVKFGSLGLLTEFNADLDTVLFLSLFERNLTVLHTTLPMSLISFTMI